MLHMFRRRPEPKPEQQREEEPPRLEEAA
jgi:hypothetical protein